MGRIMSSMLALTDPTHTVYAPESSAWFEHSASDQKIQPTIETCGIRTFALLEKSIGVFGLRGLDRLLAFRTVNIFNSFLHFYQKQVHPFRTLLDQVTSLDCLLFVFCCFNVSLSLCFVGFPSFTFSV
jgi:WASH complex subunit strumpellin